MGEILNTILLEVESEMGDIFSVDSFPVLGFSTSVGRIKGWPFKIFINISAPIYRPITEDDYVTMRYQI